MFIQVNEKELLNLIKQYNKAVSSKDIQLIKSIRNQIHVKLMSNDELLESF